MTSQDSSNWLPFPLMTSGQKFLRDCALGLGLATALTASDLWTTAYYPAYHQAQMAPAAVNFSVVSHVVHFSIVPKADGSLDTAANGLTAARSADLVAHAHAAQRKALICVGGADSAAGFRGATGSTNLPGFVDRLVSFMAGNGYDGVDLDWEPLTSIDAGRYASLAKALRTALDRRTPRPLLTAATASEPALFAALQNQFDQISLMTYDLAGPWPGWVVWFNAPIYDGGYRFPSTGGLIPSADGLVTDFLGHGVAAQKLALGIAFYGQIWGHDVSSPANGSLFPRQSWMTAPTVAPVAWTTISTDYYQPQRYHWDEAAQAAYLLLIGGTGMVDAFISYDDERACRSKVSYARNHHLGGVMIWELSQGHRGTPIGSDDPLLAAVGQALATPGAVTIQFGHDRVELGFAAAPLGIYQVQWSDDLRGGVWHPLTNYTAGTESVVQLPDPAPGSLVLPRYYRVVTPP